eukprot:1283004-Rhodomonas_salina.1
MNIVIPQLCLKNFLAAAQILYPSTRVPGVGKLYPVPGYPVFVYTRVQVLADCIPIGAYGAGERRRRWYKGLAQL